MNFVQRTVDSFERIGYCVDVFVLRSADFGVPQLRHRIFFVGNRMNKTFATPLPTVPENNYVSVGDAIGDLPELKAGESARSYDRSAFTAYQKLLRRSSRLLQGHEASSHPPHLLKAISFIPDGGDRTFIPQRYQPTSGFFHNSYSRVSVALRRPSQSRKTWASLAVHAAYTRLKIGD